MSFNFPLVNMIRNSTNSNDTILGKFRSLLKNGYYKKTYTPNEDDLRLLKEIQDLFKNGGPLSNKDIESSVNLGDNEVMKKFVESLGDTVEASKVSESSLKNWGKTADGLTKKVTIADLAVKGFNVALNALGGIVAGIALQLLITGIDNIVHAQEKAIEKGKEASENIANLKQEMQDMQSFLSSSADEFHTLAQGVDDFGNNIGLNNEQFERYNELANQIADMFPTLVKGYTETGDAIIKNADAVDLLNKAYEEQAEANRKELITQGDEVFDAAKADLFKDDSNAPWSEPGVLEQIRILKEILELSKDPQNLENRQTAFGETNEINGITRHEWNYMWDQIGLNPITVSRDEENIAQYRQTIIANLNTLESSVSAKISDVKETVQAGIEDLYDFQTLEEPVQQTFDRIFQSLDASYYSQFDSYEEAVAGVQNDILSKLKANPQITDTINNLFTISPESMSAADYQAAIDQYTQELSNAGFSDEIIAQIKVAFEIEEFDNEEREALISQIAAQVGATTDEIKQRFSETEIDLLLNPEIEWTSTDIEGLKLEVQNYKETAAALEKMSTAGATLQSSVDSVSAAMANYSTIADVVNGKMYLTKEQMLDLVGAMPDLQQYLRYTANGWTLESGAMDTVNQAVTGLSSAYVAAQQSMSESVAREAAARLGIIGNEFEQIKSVADLYAMLAGKQINIPLRFNATGGIDTSGMDQNAQVLFSYVSNLENLEKAQGLLDQSTAFTPDDSAQKAAEDQAKALDDYNEAIADAAKDYQETIKDAEETYNETIENLDLEQYNADFEHQIESATEALQAYADQLSLLSESLDGYFESDIVGRMSNITAQYQLQTQYSGELKSQMDQLLTTVPQSAEAWEQLASSLESVSEDYFENQRGLIELRSQMFETAAEAMGHISDLSSKSVEDVSDNMDRIQSIMEHGSFVYTLSDLPRVRTMDPEAVRQQRQENDLLAKEEQEYQEKVAEIRQKALDEQKAYEDEQRQEQRDEALEQYNETLANAKEQYDSALESAKESYESAMESASSSVAATNTQNMLASNDAWVADAQTEYEQFKEWLENQSIEVKAEVRYYDDKGNLIDGFGNVLVSAEGGPSLSAEGSTATYNGKGGFTTSDGSFSGWVDPEKIKNESGYKDREMKNIKIYPDGSAIWQSPNDPDKWYNLPPGSIQFRASGGETSGLTVVNETGQEGYLGKDGLLHWFKPGAQMFDTDNIVRIFNADDMQKIVTYTGDKYFKEPVGDISSVTQYASGNTSVSFPIADTNGFGDLNISHKNNRASSNGSSAESFVADILNEINQAFLGLENDISVEPIKDSIYKKLTDNRLYSDIESAVTDKTESAVEDSASNATEKLFNSILSNSDWDDFSKEVQDQFAQLGVDGDTWSEWIEDPNNALQAMQLMQDGSVDSWDMLSSSMQEILNAAGINSSETWSTYVKEHPIEALVLLTDSWDTMLTMISQYMNDAIAIATNGANAIHAISIEAPQISQASWSNLQTLIANKIQEILNVINETFGANTIDLNFGVSLSGNEQTNPQGSGEGNSLVSTAEQYLGTPYVWGGSSPSGFDCSGFVQYVMAQNGITIPRTSQSQFHSGTAVDKASLAPGDLVFFGPGSEPSHVGMYVGNDTFIHSPHTGDVVKYSSLNSSYYLTNYMGARRYYASGTSGAQAGTALVGDEYLLTGAKHPTPELIFSKKSKRMYLAGLNGAETVKLGAGDVVVPYDRTKDILDSSNGLDGIPSFANGSNNFFSRVRSILSDLTDRSSKSSSDTSSKNKSSKNTSNKPTQLYQDGYPVEEKGVLIDVPDGLGKYYTYMAWDAITNMDTQQGKLIQAAGKHYDAEGYGRVGDRYTLAMTSTFGAIGDYVDVYMSNGRVIHGILADEKSQVVTFYDSHPANKWGHNNGQNVVEWVTNWRGHNNPPSDGEVLYVVNVGNYFGNPSFAGVGNYARESIVAQKIREAYKKIEPLLGYYTTNTHTSTPKVAPYRSLGSSRQSSYSFDTPFTRYAYGTNGAVGGLSLVGEEAPEYAVYPNGEVEKLGKDGAEVVDLPKGTRILNAKQTKMVDRYTGGIDGETIHAYANGTESDSDVKDELTSEEKGWIDSINKHLSEDDQLTAEAVKDLGEGILENMYDAVKGLEDDEETTIDILKHQAELQEDLNEIIEPYKSDEFQNKLYALTEEYNGKLDDINSYYKGQFDSYLSKFNDWLKVYAGTDRGMQELYPIMQSVSDYNDEYLKATTQAGIQYVNDQIALQQPVLDSLNALYEKATTADERNMIQEYIDDVQDALDELNDQAIEFYEVDRDRILSSIEEVGLAHSGRYGTGTSYIEKEVEDIQDLLDNAEDDSERSKIYDDLSVKLDQLYNGYMDSANAYHDALEELRNDDVYGYIFDKYSIDELFDANGEFNDLYYQMRDFIAQTAPTELEAFETAAEAAQAAKQGFMDATESAKDAKQQQEDIKRQQEEIADNQALEKVQTYLDLQQRLSDILDYQMQRQQALINAKQQLYSLTQTLRDETAEIESQLKANKHLAEWLDPQERQLLFNEDDYSKEMSVIEDIQAEAEKLYDDYYDRISNLSEEDLWQEEQLTAEYERQMEVLNERLDIAKQDLQIAKKRVEYNNALKERDTQVFMGNRAVNIADPDTLYNLALEVSNLETDKENTLQTNAENENIRNMERDNDELAAEQAAIQNRVEMLNAMTEEEQIAFADLLKPIEYLEAQLETIEFSNPFYMIDTDNTDSVYLDQDIMDGVSHGTSLVYDYERGSQFIQQMVDQGIVSPEVGREIQLRAWADHDYKTSTDPHNAGYPVHNPNSKNLDGLYVLPTYDYSIVKSEENADVTSQEQIESSQDNSGSLENEGKDSSQIQAVKYGLEEDPFANVEFQITEDGNLVFDMGNGTVFVVPSQKLPDIFPNVTNFNPQGEIYHPQDWTVDANALMDYYQRPQTIDPEFIVGNTNQAPVDNSTTYSINNVYVTDPVVSATDVVSSLTQQVQNQNAINKNTR